MTQQDNDYLGELFERLDDRLAKIQFCLAAIALGNARAQDKVRKITEVVWEDLKDDATFGE